MRQILLNAALGIFALIGLAGVPSWAQAGDPYHSRYHDDLEHRDFHRYLFHQDAHRYPMTWRQHDRLHDALEHDAFHDRLEHREFHRNYYSPPCFVPVPPSYGFGVQSRNFSIWFGR